MEVSSFFFVVVVVKFLEQYEISPEWLNKYRYTDMHIVLLIVNYEPKLIYTKKW